MYDEIPDEELLLEGLRRQECEESHLYFTRHFFKARQGIKFKINWHHALISDTLQGVIDGRIKNCIINVPPGSSKTELAVINFIARGLALNPRARFLHLSGSDSLAALNSSQARDIVRSDEFQALWPISISDDADSKKRWNVLVDGQTAGGVYATSLGGQVTGFRAGHMAPGFQGAIIIDDPIKPEDAFSKPKLEAANRKLITTVKSRKANPATPIIIIMQRIAENDCVGFIKKGALGNNWTLVKIPALIRPEYIKKLPERYKKYLDESEKDTEGRCSYWPYKEPIKELLKMEAGEGSDQAGSLMSRHVFSSQYNQEPKAIGGNIIKGTYFVHYTVLPKIRYRKIFVDTAQKTKERNDYSVFEEWGLGVDNRIYLLDMIRGKFEAPELIKRAIAFWAKCKAKNVDNVGALREMMIEDKSAGTGLIQTLKSSPNHVIPVKGIERSTDKYSRVNDVLPYIEQNLVCVPEDAPFTSDFILEAESFTADDSHDHDDQVDPMVDAINDMLSTGNKMEQWRKLGKKG